MKKCVTKKRKIAFRHIKKQVYWSLLDTDKKKQSEEKEKKKKRTTERTEKINQMKNQISQMSLTCLKQVK